MTRSHAAVLVRVRAGVWFAFSRSMQGRRYRIDVAYTGIAGWGVVCNCPGHLSHGYCKHAREALAKEYAEMVNERAVARRQGDAMQRFEPLPVPKLDEAMRMQVSTILPSPADTVAMVQIANLMTKQGEDPKETFKMLLAGWELGVGPMTALRRMFNVRGKIEPDAQLMLALALSKDATLKVMPRGDATQCTVTVERRGSKYPATQYTIEDANRSGQTKIKTFWDAKAQKRVEVPGPWQLYTADMLKHAAIKRALKAYAPDLINNVKGLSLGAAEAMIAPEDDIIDEIEAVEHAAAPDAAESAGSDAPEPAGDDEHEDMTDYRATLLGLLQQASETTDAAFMESLMTELRTRYRYALSQAADGKPGRFDTTRLTEEHAKDSVAMVLQRLGFAPPDEAEDDSEQASEGSEQAGEDSEDFPTG